MKKINDKNLKAIYGQLEYVKTRTGVRLRNRYTAPYQDGMQPYYFDATISRRVPQSSVEELVRLSRRGNTRDEALQHVKSATVVGLIDTALTSIRTDEEGSNVILQDVLVLQLNDPKLRDVYVYVKQEEAGSYQPSRLGLMVGSNVPVSIVDLKLVQAAERYDSDRPISEQVLEDQYVAVGSISRAEYLINEKFKEEFEASEKNAAHDVMKGVVLFVTNNGVVVQTPNMERVYIPHNYYSYKSRSEILKPKDYISVGDIVDFQVTNVAIDSPTDEEIKNGISGQKVRLVGSRRRLEVHPSDIMKSIYDGGEVSIGRILTGYIVKYQPVRGHLFEPEDAPGYTLLLQVDPSLTKDMMEDKQLISVRIIDKPEYDPDRKRYSIRTRLNTIFNPVQDDFYNF